MQYMEDTLTNVTNRKAHPDEKGTESKFLLSLGFLFLHRKAHPDEKGTESFLSQSEARMLFSDRKAHPDEKGTESAVCGF